MRKPLPNQIRNPSHQRSQRSPVAHSHPAAFARRESTPTADPHPSQDTNDTHIDTAAVMVETKPTAPTLPLPSCCRSPTACDTQPDLAATEAMTTAVAHAQPALP